MILKILLLSLLLLTPNALSAQAYAYDKVEFVPTAFHRTIYAMMEGCSGVEGEFENIRWYTAKMILVGDPTLGQQWIGIWYQSADLEWAEIILDREFVFDGVTVSHEALHDLFEGIVPMDVANRCVLDWSRLTVLRRRENE